MPILRLRRRRVASATGRRAEESRPAPPFASKACAALALALVALSARAPAVGGPSGRPPRPDARRREELRALEAVATEPHEAEAWLRLARARRERADLDGALAALGQARLWRPADASTWREAAAAHLAAHRQPEAARELACLVDDGPDTLRLRAELALLEGRTEAAWRAAHAALRQAPGDAAVTATAAEAAYRSGRLDRARRLYATTVRLDPWHEVANMRLGSGFSPHGGRLVFRSVAQRAAFDEASQAWRDHDLETALRRFADLVADAPDEPRFRLGLGLVLRERAWAESAAAPPASWQLEEEARRPVVGEEHLVPGIAALPHDHLAIVRRALRPWEAWLPQLIAAGGRHEILPLASSLVDAPERDDLADQTTFDGRWYAHLRGVGGLHAATGEEKLRAAACHEFDTFAHELAHQILTYALPADVQGEVHALWRRAVEANRCLDAYAASNADEYFAQGYEAFLSTWKLPGIRRTACHTRDELAARDPDLLALLERLTTPRPGRDQAPDALPPTPDAPPAQR
ncbi:MAG: hypothetical protein R3E85_06675 [Planctomycetota bacterium]